MWKCAVSKTCQTKSVENIEQLQFNKETSTQTDEMTRLACEASCYHIIITKYVGNNFKQNVAAQTLKLR